MSLLLLVELLLVSLNSWVLKWFFAIRYQLVKKTVRSDSSRRDLRDHVTNGKMYSSTPGSFCWLVTLDVKWINGMWNANAPVEFQMHDSYATHLAISWTISIWRHCPFGYLKKASKLTQICYIRLESVYRRFIAYFAIYIGKFPHARSPRWFDLNRNRKLSVYWFIS